MRGALPRNSAFSCSPISPTYSTSGLWEERFDLASVIDFIRAIDLGGDAELDAGSLRDFNGPIDALLR